MSVSRKGLVALSDTSKGLTARKRFRFAQYTRSVSSTTQLNEPQETAGAGADTPTLDPRTVYTPKQERLLWENQRLRPIGSRRMRVAKATNPGIPFEQLPYQCFQEARKVLAENRNEILGKIQAQTDRIERIKKQEAGAKDAQRDGQAIRKLTRNIQGLIIEADSHDPMILKTFEDGKGDMNKPIYRHLADTKWREMRRKVVMQRVEQMFVTPDVLPSIDATSSVELKFPRGTKVQPGQFVDSRLSQYPPVVNVQVFNKDNRLVSIVFVDSDVPNLETDDFEHRCHGIFANLEVGPTSGPINLGHKKYQENIIQPWIPPTAQKGSPYHRISAWVLEHNNNEPLDVEGLSKWIPEMEKIQEQRFSMREFVAKTQTKPVGVTMFRIQWDDGMLEIMKRYNIPGADVALKRRLPEKLPYKKKDSRRYR